MFLFFSLSICRLDFPVCNLTKVTSITQTRTHILTHRLPSYILCLLQYTDKAVSVSLSMSLLLFSVFFHSVLFWSIWFYYSLSCLSIFICLAPHYFYLLFQIMLVICQFTWYPGRSLLTRKHIITYNYYSHT